MIPFTPLTKPLHERTVTLVSTAGVARNDDRPFDQDGERRNPWWGDLSFRVIPLGTTLNDIRRYHLHIDPRFGEADLDVVLPMRRPSPSACAPNNATRRRWCPPDRSPAGPWDWSSVSWRRAAFRRWHSR